MAGYVKMWTTLRNNEAFLSLNCTARGVYMQLILAAKDQRDDGSVCYRNVSALGSDCGCDRRTCDKVLTILSQKSLCTVTKNGDGVVLIQIPNYIHWQKIDVDGVRQKRRKNVTKIPPLRPEQTIPEQTIPYKAVVDHLNLLTAKDYSPEREHSRKWIRARWNEGFRLDDFIYVNQVKAEQWLGTEREKYLRPETLYGNKMEGYRQERRIPRQYSEKTNKALVAAALFLKNKGVTLETSGLTEISSGTDKAPVSIS